MPVTMKIPVHTFGIKNLTSTSETSVEVLGGKGAGLVYLTQQGIATPPGFILPTSLCAEYFKNPALVMGSIATVIPTYLKALKEQFGYMPLLSVRSGARASMPGMMDTILNVGLDASNGKEWATRLNKPCVIDSRRRLIEMYGSVVKGIDRSKFHGKDSKACNEIYTKETGEAFPDAEEQLLSSIEAVFKSWNNERAKVYRKLNGIPDSWGTAVTVMAMVFGNMNDKSGTGVLFTRNPDTGEDKVTGEFLVNAQGEDVVAGTATPMPLSKMGEWNPDLYTELHGTVKKLEQAKRDVQDVEFTVQDGKLYILQTRNAKRSARAAARIAVDMFLSKCITAEEAAKRVTFREYLMAQSPSVDPAFTTPAFATGLAACTGVVTGVVVHTKEAAVAAKEPVVLVSEETTPDDIAGMLAAVGVLTMTGGSTSHAAVVARAMNKPTVVGLGKTLEDFPAGSLVSICGATGRVWKCEVPTVSGKSAAVTDFEDLMTTTFNLKPGAVVMANGRPVITVAEDVNKQATVSNGQPVLVDVRLPHKAAVEQFNAMFSLDAETEAQRVEGVRALLNPEAVNKVKFITSEPVADSVVVTSDFKEICKATDWVVADQSKLEDWQLEVLQWKKAAKGETKLVTLGYSPSPDSFYSLAEALAAKLPAAV